MPMPTKAETNVAKTIATVTIQILNTVTTAILTTQSNPIPMAVCPNRIRCDGYWSLIHVKRAAHRRRQDANAIRMRVCFSTVKSRLHTTYAAVAATVSAAMMALGLVEAAQT